jgi:transposase, IS30 family
VEAVVVAQRLSELEREQIASGRDSGESIRSIALRLGRSPSTISREITRTALDHLHCRYSSWWAHRLAQQQASKSRRAPRLAQAGPLRTEVIEKLNKRWSPRQIASWLKLEFPDRPEMHVSHETIYQAIYLQARGNLRAELKHQKALRSGRTRRRAHPAGAISSNRPWVELHISERPAEAEDRAVPGHWEGDLLAGQGNHSAIATLVERSTRFVMLVALPGGKVSEHVAAQLSQAMARLPEALRRSLTWDQGSEMAGHAQFSLATSCPVYFCDPHSPWQRGSNENTNGLLRDYFPVATTDFRKINQTQLDEVADELNTRIRETLNWATPAAKLAELLTVANAA